MPRQPNMRPHLLSPYLEIGREDWTALAPSMASPLREDEVKQLRGLGDPLNMTEVAEVYLPLSRLLALHVAAQKSLHRATSKFLGGAGGADRVATTPFVIGVAGSVAVGKSTVARLLRELLLRWDATPRVELITTDGFLYPNAVLEQRGLLGRKGFPESYDRRALLNFVADIKSGSPAVQAPVYSHLEYDIVPDKFITVRSPDVLIVEGLNVLQPAVGGGRALSDLFDFTVYVDADPDDIKHWYVERFLSLQRSAFTDPASYFHRYAKLNESEAREQAGSIWDAINGPNLEENIQPTRSRASLILRKTSAHTVSTVYLRKL